jgi:hypothetical protein
MNQRSSNILLAETLFSRRDMKAHTGSCTHVDDFNPKNGTTPTCIHVSSLRTMTCSSAPVFCVELASDDNQMPAKFPITTMHERKVKGRVGELFGSLVTAC